MYTILTKLSDVYTILTKLSDVYTILTKLSDMYIILTKLLDVYIKLFLDGETHPRSEVFMSRVDLSVKVHRKDQSVESFIIKCLFLLFLIISCISLASLIEISSFC